MAVSTQLHAGEAWPATFDDPANIVPSFNDEPSLPASRATCLVAVDFEPLILATKYLDICFVFGSKWLQNPYPCVPFSATCSASEIGWGFCEILCKGFARSFNISAKDRRIAGTESVFRIPMSLQVGFEFINVCRFGEVCCSHSHVPRLGSLLWLSRVYGVVAVGLWSSVTIVMTRAKRFAPRIRRLPIGSAEDMNLAADIAARWALPTLRNEANIGLIEETVEAAVCLILRLLLFLRVLILCCVEFIVWG